MITKHTLDLSDAKRMVEAGEAFAIQQGLRLSFAIIDDGGHLILLHRMDGATIASIEIAIRKARAAALYRCSTRNFEQGMTAGNIALAGLPDMIGFEGGLPVIQRDEVLGAIGVSGGQTQEDGAAAQVGFEQIQEC